MFHKQKIPALRKGISAPTRNSRILSFFITCPSKSDTFASRRDLCVHARRKWTSSSPDSMLKSCEILDSHECRTLWRRRRWLLVCSRRTWKPLEATLKDTQKRRDPILIRRISKITLRNKQYTTRTFAQHVLGNFGMKFERQGDGGLKLDHAYLSR